MKVTITVKNEHVLDQIENLTVNYSPWILEYKVIPDGWSFKFEKEDGKIVNKIITMKHLEKGMSKLAQEAPHRFGNIVTGDSDAIDADCFIQCAIFGKLVYA
jgi:hypothetical protein